MTNRDVGRFACTSKAGNHRDTEDTGGLSVLCVSVVMGFSNRIKTARVTIRKMTDRISIDPEVQHGKPVIRGTRVPVSRILGSLAGGMTRGEIVEEYGVTTDDIAAALEFATELVDEEQFHALPTR